MEVGVTCREAGLFIYITNVNITMQVGTKRTIGYIVVSFLWLCFTSCAGIFRTTYYITETQGWKKADYNGVNDIAYTNDTTPDSIMLNVRGPGAANFNRAIILSLCLSHMPTVLDKTLPRVGGLKPNSTCVSHTRFIHKAFALRIMRGT